MDNYTIELIKQVGAVGFITILLIKQNGKNYDKLLKMTSENFSKLFDKVEDIWHKQDSTYKSCEELTDYFSDISETHKLKKFKILAKCFEGIKEKSVDIEELKFEIEKQFKTITKEECQKLNKIKSRHYNKDLGDKFYKKIDWKSYIPEVMKVVESSSSIADLEDKFFALTDHYLITIRTALKI